jgi:hypothetical protein
MNVDCSMKFSVLKFFSKGLPAFRVSRGPVFLMARSLSGSTYRIRRDHEEFSATEYQDR